MKCPECGKEFSEPILNFHIERCKVKEKSNSKKLYFPIVLFYDIIVFFMSKRGNGLYFPIVLFYDIIKKLYILQISSLYFPIVLFYDIIKRCKSF